MAAEFSLCPPGKGSPLQPDTPLEDLSLPVGIKGHLKTLGYKNLKDLALASPERLHWPGAGQDEVRLIATLLEDFFLSLDRTELLLYYWYSLLAWEPFLPQSELVRQMVLSFFLPMTCIDRVFPKGDQPQPPGLRIPVRNLDVSVRASNCLKISGIANVHELALASPKLLLHVRNLGCTTLSELAAVVEDYFNSLEPSVMAIYEESYQLWKPLLVGRPPSPEGVHIRLPEPDLSPVPEPDLSPTMEMSPPDPAIYGDPPRPPGLDVPFSDLLLPARALSCLERWGITNLHELALILPNEFLKAYNFGLKSLGEVAKVLEEYFNSLGQPGQWKVYDASFRAWKRYFTNPSGYSGPKPEPAPPPSVMELISGFLSQQNARDRGIFMKRFALMPSSSPETLGTIGRSLGLTRERVRQIASKLQKTVTAIVRRSHPSLMPRLRAYLDKVTVATLDEVVSLVPRSGESTEFHFGRCIRLLLSSSPGVYSIDPAGQLWTSNVSIDRDFYCKVINAAKGVLFGMPTDLANLAPETARKLRCCGQEIDAVRVIIRNATPIFHVQPSNQRVGPPEVRGVQARRRAFAYAYIREQGVPTTVFEMFHAMEEMEPVIVPHFPTRHLAIHSLRSLLERDDRFAWAGLSAYGLREWGYEPGVTSIGQATVALLRKAGRLTMPKIQKTLGKLYRLSPNSIAMALDAEKGKTLTRDSDGRWRALRF
jgi:hypothetical protein